MKRITRSPVIRFKHTLALLILSWFIAVDAPLLENYHTEIVECEEDQKQFESDFNKTCIRIESLSGTLFYYNKLQNLNMNCSHRGPVFCYSEKQLEGCIYVEGVIIQKEKPNFFKLSQKFFASTNTIPQEQQGCLNLLYYKYLKHFYKFYNDIDLTGGNSHGPCWIYVLVTAVVTAVITFLIICITIRCNLKFRNWITTVPNLHSPGKKKETVNPDQLIHSEVADTVPLPPHELENLNTS